jgi:nitroimidazol reductase NimA-like FMN-containing flavoprotein (pyridoxamine 5'-phosphate oxidase superfamily)
MGARSVGRRIMRALDLTGGTEILSEDDCWDLLAGEEVGRMAVVVEGRPDILPVNYEVVDRSLIFQTNMGHKLLGASRAEVAFEVDSYDRQRRTGWSVVLHGPVVDASDEKVGPSKATWSGRKDYRLRLEALSISGRAIPFR